jgi:hypothetical protein
VTTGHKEDPINIVPKESLRDACSVQSEVCLRLEGVTVKACDAPKYASAIAEDNTALSRLIMADIDYEFYSTLLDRGT